MLSDLRADLAAELAVVGPGPVMAGAEAWAGTTSPSAGG
jgi:hypothetical protein